MIKLVKKETKECESSWNILKFDKEDTDVSEWQEPVYMWRDEAEKRAYWDPKRAELVQRAGEDPTAQTLADMNALMTGVNGVKAGGLEELEEAQEALVSKRNALRAKRRARARNYLPTRKMAEARLTSEANKLPYEIVDDGGHGRHRYTATPEIREAAVGRYALMIMREDGVMEIVGVDEFFDTRQQVRHRQVTSDDVEIEMSAGRRKRRNFDRWSQKVEADPAHDGGGGDSTSTSSASSSALSKSSPSRLPFDDGIAEWATTSSSSKKSVYDNDNDDGNDTMADTLFRVNTLKRGDDFDYEKDFSDNEDEVTQATKSGAFTSYSSDEDSDDLNSVGRELRAIMRRKADDVDKEQQDAEAARKQALELRRQLRQKENADDEQLLAEDAQLRDDEEAVDADDDDADGTGQASSSRKRTREEIEAAAAERQQAKKQRRYDPLGEANRPPNERKIMETEVIRVLRAKGKMRAGKLMKRVLAKNISDPLLKRTFFEIVKRVAMLIKDPKSNQQFLILKKDYQ
jgi:hypothetical protein